MENKQHNPFPPTKHFEGVIQITTLKNWLRKKCQLIFSSAIFNGILTFAKVYPQQKALFFFLSH